MITRIVLISNDNDFYEYVAPKLKLRKNDELYNFGFDKIPEKLYLLTGALLIVNSENAKQETLDLLNITQENPVIVFSYNNDEDYRVKCYNAGAFDCFTPSMSNVEFKLKIKTALKMISYFEKNNFYREILVKNHIIAKNNNVLYDSDFMLDFELEELQKNANSAVLAAISPDEKSKFLLQPNQIETIILNNIRKSDILINFSHNKYFLLLHNVDIVKAVNIWKKIKTSIPENIYAGFAEIGSKTRQQVVNEALNKLHEDINKNHSAQTFTNIYAGNNFKLFRQEFNKKIEQVISPVFYHVQQIYNKMSLGMQVEQGIGDGYGILYIKSRHAFGSLRITSPGFSKINIDITFQTFNEKVMHEQPSIDKIIKMQDLLSENIESKRITLEPEELESGLLQDLIEQFLTEFKQEV